MIQTYAKVAYEKARKANLTLRDIYNQIAVARGYLFAYGTAATIADVMEEWFTERACDGFVLVPPYFPAAFDEFIDQVVPELQRRGLFRREYSGSTLREHLGLPVPPNRYSKAHILAHEAARRRALPPGGVNRKQIPEHMRRRGRRHVASAAIGTRLI